MRIKIRDLSFQYKQTSIFQKLNVEFDSRQVNYLIGYNGAGKSTLFDILSDLQTDYSGSTQGRPSKDEILYQTQNPVVFGTLNGKDLQKFVFGIAQSHESVELEELSPHFRNLYIKLMKRKVGKMSVGERRWLLLFLESKLDKKLFLLDEPFSGVDPVSKIQIEEIISDLAKKENTCVIVTTHELDHLIKGNCSIHLLNNGEIQSFDSYEEFIKNSDHHDPKEAFAKLVKM